MKLKPANFTLLAGLMLISFAGCADFDTKFYAGNETVQYQMYDQVTVDVILVDGKVQEERTFANEDEVDALDAEMTKGFPAVEVNKQLWRELGHYFDPYTVSLLSNNGTIVIGGHRYKATRTEMLVEIAGSNDWKRAYYYGESGTVDLEESKAMVDFIVSNIEPKKKFENEKYHKIHQELISNKIKKGSRIYYVMNRDEAPFQFSTFNTQKEIPFKDVSGVSKVARLEYWGWNESYRKYVFPSWRERSKGGTYVLINRDGYWDNLNGQDKIGPYLDIAGFVQDISLPLTYVKVIGGGGFSNDQFSNTWEVALSNVGRKKNTGTTSEHAVSHREDYSNTQKLIVSWQFLQ